MRRHNSCLRFLLLFSLFVFLFVISGGDGVVRGEVEIEPNTNPYVVTTIRIREADGHARLSEHGSLEQARAAAVLNAKRQIVENAFQSMTPLFWRTYQPWGKWYICPGGEGPVNILEMKDYGVENDIRYHVWIRAKVRFCKTSRYPVRRPPKVDMDGPFTVKVWTAKKVYREGESIRVIFIGNRDFYGCMVHVDQSGVVTQLLPNRYRSDTHFFAGRNYAVPIPTKLLSPGTNAPLGRARIVVFASQSMLRQLVLEKSKGGWDTYPFYGTLDAYEDMVRPPDQSGVEPELLKAIWEVNTEPLPPYFPPGFLH